uniref:Uncharacterized protein n=1 Tax=Spermophilus dauricus TaxID=99837 RepID=A0A8C9UVN1_SPEDA
VQNDVMRFVLAHYLYTPQKCSTSNRTIDAKDHASIQISMTEVDKVPGRFNDCLQAFGCILEEILY